MHENVPAPELDIVAIEEALRQAGVSVAALCRRADVNQTTWQRLKDGATGRANRRTRTRLAEAFDELVPPGHPARGHFASHPNPIHGAAA